MLFSQENSISLTLLTPSLSSELSLHHFLKKAFPIVSRLGQFLLLHDPTELCSIPSEHYPLFQGLCLFIIFREEGFTHRYTCSA